jgi:hypothetical protein
MAFGLLQPDEDLDPAFRQEAAITNATRAAELQNQFLDRQREILHTGPEAFRSKTGRDAVLGADDVLARLESLRQETLDQAANEAQQQLLRGPLSQHRLLEHATVGDHVGRQTRAWRNATAASRLDLLRRQAELDYSDPDTIEALHTASDSASQELSRTMPRDAGDTFVDPGDRPSIWRAAIDAALGKFDFPSAIVLYNRAADRLDPTDLKVLTPQIEAAREFEIGHAYLAKLGLPETQDLAELDSAHQAATAQNQVDWPDSPSQRATNQHFIDVAFGRLKSNVVQASASLGRAVDDWLNQLGPDGRPQVERPPLALWASLSLNDRQRVDEVLKQNAAKAPDLPQREDRRPPASTPQSNEDHLARDLLQSSVDATVPGAYYARLAHQAFGSGNYLTAGGYSIASLLDAAVGVASLGAATKLGGAARAALGTARSAIEDVLHGSAAGLGKAAAALVARSRIKRLPPGSFSIIDWTGYPESLPKPTGPFRLLKGAEYGTARDTANSVNRALHRKTPSLRGKHFHENHPVKFGGDPTDPSNKTVLSRQEHDAVTAWWYQLQREVEQAR